MKEFNIFFKCTRYDNLYNNNQLIDYDEYVAVEHIIDRHSNDFSEHIDIYSLFNEIKSKLIDEYRVDCLKFNDVYDIPYQNVGYDKHIIRVYTIPNTKNILTMYPLEDKNIRNSDIPEIVKQLKR